MKSIVQENQLFEYAIIRVVPRVEREEFINVGVIVYCASQKFIDCLFILDEIKLNTFCPLPDINDLSDNLESFEKICSGKKEGGAIAKLDMASRFRWLTATRSTILQTSKVHPGLCFDAEQTLNKLFNNMVL